MNAEQSHSPSLPFSAPCTLATPQGGSPPEGESASKEPAPLASTPVRPTPVDADLALRTLQLLQSLLEKVVGERAIEESRARTASRRTYTPRSEVPLGRLASPPLMTTRVRRRSVQFSCPCCGRETVIVRRQAGARIRCPHCRSALAAPLPRHGRSAHTLERDIEALLHPDSFAAAVRPAAPRWVRLVAKEPVLILALAALVPFTALLMLEVPFVIEKSKGGVPASVVRVEPQPPMPSSPADGASERAVALVERYLAAPTAQLKAACVRDPQRVSLLMASLAARQPEIFAPVTATEIKAAGLSHYQDPSNPVPVTPVVARLANGTTRTFIVEHASSGDAIEWESSTGYSEPLELASTTRTHGASAAPQALWRVEAAPDDYFNRAFADENNLICLKLARADRPDDTFWAYTPKVSKVAAALRRIWNEAPHDFVQRLTVTVEAGPATASTRQVRLAAVNHAGWRTPDSATILVAGNP